MSIGEEREIRTLCDGFVRAWGDRALERAVVVWMRLRGGDERRVIEAVLDRLHARAPISDSVP